MRGVQISYLSERPEYLPLLAQWLFEQWGVTLGERTPEARVEKLKTHMNRDKLPIAWVAHANGQLLGTAALRVHDLEAREDLTPWLGGVFVGSHFRRQGIGAALCATVEDEARSRGIHTLYLFTLDKQTWYSRLGWTVIDSCIWQQRPGDIMSKPLFLGPLLCASAHTSKSGSLFLTFRAVESRAATASGSGMATA